MTHLLFASHNKHKVEEIRAILGPDFSVSGLSDLGLVHEIPEPHHSLEENALAKVRFVARNHNLDCFADDTGLETEALNGLPGVLSARYAGPAKNSRANIDKLLKELSGKNNRKARFRTVIALVMDGKEHLFEGVVNGIIAREPRGEHGFGYDPVFIPDGYNKTFAEMDAEEKNRISHRWMAIDRLAGFLKQSSAPR